MGFYGIYNLPETWDSDTEEEPSESENREIDYPDAAEVYWSDEEDVKFHIRDSSRSSPVLRSRRLRMRIHPYIRSVKTTKPNPDVYNKTVPPKNKTDGCAICLENTDLNSDNEHIYCSSQCGNIFHYSCMLTYTKPNPPNFAKCPLCRTWSNFEKLCKKNKTVENHDGNIMSKKSLIMIK